MKVNSKQNKKTKQPINETQKEDLKQKKQIPKPNKRSLAENLKPILNNKTKAIVSSTIITAIVISIISLTGYFIINSNKIINQLVFFDNSNKNKKQLSPTPKQEQINVGVDVSKIDQIDPWGHAADKIQEDHELPEAKDLDDIYMRIRYAVDNRDYEIFTKYANSERIWHTENSKKLIDIIQEDDQEYSVFEIININGQENFEKNAPFGITLNSPKYEYLQPRNVTVKESRTRSPFIIKDSNTGEYTKVNAASWKKAVTLFYEVQNSPNFTGKGQVHFTYEKGEWKYYGEEWQTELKDKEPIGDNPDLANNVYYLHKNTKANQVFFAPQEISIKKGDAIVFNELLGMVYTLPESTSHWSSPYVQYKNYCKIFDQVGEYQYQIYRLTNPITGTIKVE